MAYGEFKDLPRRRKVLGDKAFNITKNPKYDGYQGGLALTVHNFFSIKNLLLLSLTYGLESILKTKQLADKLHKLFFH